MIETEDFIIEIVEKIVAFYHPEKVFLFGPFCIGNITRNSEISLLLIKDTILPKSERTKAIYDHLQNTIHPVDLLVYSPVEYYQSMIDNRSFISNVLKMSKVLYDKDHEL